MASRGVWTAAVAGARAGAMIGARATAISTARNATSQSLGATRLRAGRGSGGANGVMFLGEGRCCRNWDHQGPAGPVLGGRGACAHIAPSGFTPGIERARTTEAAALEPHSAVMIYCSWTAYSRPIPSSDCKAPADPSSLSGDSPGRASASSLQHDGGFLCLGIGKAALQQKAPCAPAPAGAHTRGCVPNAWDSFDA